MATTTLCSCGFTELTAQGVGSKVADSRALHNLASPQDSVFIHGFVERRPEDAAEDVAIVASTLEGESVATASVGRLGYYSLFVPPGTYFLTGYVDRDQDGRITQGEMAGQTPTSLSVQRGSKVAYIGVDIELGKAGDQRDPTLRQLLNEPIDLGVTVPSLRPAGSFGADVFAQDLIDKGTYGSTTAFFNQAAPIQSLNEVDLTDGRVPLVLVHGINDSPKVFRHLLDHVSDDRYLTLFFYYPTGARLPAMAQLLYHLFFSGRVIPTFDAATLVAHSMGGLVARGSFDFFTTARGETPVRFYGSFDTPYGGISVANWGIMTGPVIIPSWIDVASESTYLGHLFSALPSSTTFCMINGNIDGDSDGMIPLSSQRRPEAVEQAKYTAVFPQTHVGIMSDQSAVETMMGWAESVLSDRLSDDPAAPTPLTNDELVARSERFRRILVDRWRTEGEGILVSRITDTLVRLRIRNRDVSTVVQVSVGRNLRVDVPSQTDPLLLRAWPDDQAALKPLANEVVELMRAQLQQAPGPRGRPFVPAHLTVRDTSDSAPSRHGGANARLSPPPIVLSTGLMYTTRFNPSAARLEIPFRIDAYLGAFGLGGFFRYTPFASLWPNDGADMLYQPWVIGGGPRVRLGTRASVLSLSTGMNVAVETGRAGFYPGDSKRFQLDRGAALRHIWMTNLLLFITTTAGVAIRPDFYATLTAQAGLRKPEKEFRLDSETTVRFFPHPFLSLGAGVEVRLP